MRHVTFLANLIGRFSEYSINSTMKLLYKLAPGKGSVKD